LSQRYLAPPPQPAPAPVPEVPEALIGEEPEADEANEANVPPR
jgi:hypothetical protein